MRIGLDFDGVITNCGELKSTAAKLLYDKDIPARKFKRETILKEGLLTDLEYKTLQKLVYENNFGYSMKPVEGMLEYLPKLMAEHEVTIITCRDQKSEEIAHGWMKLNAPHLRVPIVSVGKNSKAPACEGIDLFVDDDLEKLEKMVGVVPHRYLMSWGYNGDESTGDVASRVYSWQHIYDTVKGLEGYKCKNT